MGFKRRTNQMQCVDPVLIMMTNQLTKESCLRHLGHFNTDQILDDTKDILLILLGMKWNQDYVRKCLYFRHAY